MWLSKMAIKKTEQQPSANVGQVTISGEAPAVMTRCEHRSLPVYGPGGLVWMPEVGSNALVIKTSEGYAVAGTAVDNSGLEPGDVMLVADGCSIKLSGDRIELEGRVFVNGTEVL